MTNILSSIRRTIYEGRRPSKWRRASKYVKKMHPYCSMCYLEKTLEAHDIFPYRKIRNPKKKSFKYWVNNMIVLCRHDHRRQAHCGDKSCYKYHTDIEKLCIQICVSRIENCRK